MKAETERRSASLAQGPAGLMAAETMALAGRSVVVHDASPSPARKFLLAGRGGLNLTHSEPLQTFLARYGPAADRLLPAIEAFPPDRLRGWAAELGEETFIGSSGRRFSEELQGDAAPSRLAATPRRAWRQLCSTSRFLTNGALRSWRRRARQAFKRLVVFALRPRGRASGADGRLGSRLFALKGIDGYAAEARQLRLPSRLVAEDTGNLRRRATQKSRRFLDAGMRVRGEAMVTSVGLEGVAQIYALSASLREAIVNPTGRRR